MSQTNKMLVANGLCLICATGLLLACHIHARDLDGLSGVTIETSHQVLSQKGYQLLKQEAEQELWFNEQAASCTRVQLKDRRILRVDQVATTQCHSLLTRQHVEQLEKTGMEEYCIGVAAEKFTRQPAEILTEPTEPDGNQFIVYGEFDDEDKGDITTFHCAFSKEGQLRSIEKTS